MTKLQVAPNLPLPANTVSATIIVYGGKGQGKTNFGSVVAEELFARNLRFSVIDPMGVWYGLQHGRTKEESGIEVLILGGIHGDIPINPQSGEIVADLVADERVSVIIDISRHENGKAWSKGEKIRFVRDYMIRLYERQVEHRYPIMQIIDEAARYAPQSFITGDKDAAQCFGAIQTIAEEGRNLGIGLMLLTQRSARLNKDVAELADMLVSFRIVGPNSANAILDWFGDHIPRERHKALMERLRQLPKGTALIVSPGWLNIEGEANIRLRHTFDSSATPEIGKTLKAPGKAKKPDLEKYRDRMAETIKEAEDNNPKKLQSRIKTLEAENQSLRDRPEPDPVAAPPQFDFDALRSDLERIMIRDDKANKEAVRIMDETIQQAIHKAEQDHLETLAIESREIRKAIEAILNTESIPASSPRASIPKPRPDPIPPSMPPPRPESSRKILSAGNGSSNNGPAEGGERAILTVIVQNQARGSSSEYIGIMVNYKKSSRNAYLARLQAKGLIRRENRSFYPTQEGIIALGEYEALPTGPDLQQFWIDHVPDGERKFLAYLIDHYPNAYSREQLGAAIPEYLKSSRNAYIARLQQKQLIIPDSEGFKASDHLFS